MEHSATFFLFIFLFVSSCVKKTNEQTRTHTVYQLALGELQEHGETDFGYKKALALLDQELQQNNYDPVLEGLRATCLFKLHNYKDAEVVFKKVLRETNSGVLHAELENNYACLLAATGRIQEAEFMWSRLLTSNHYLTPEVALANLAKVKISAGDFDQAKLLLDQALKKAPSFSDAWYYRMVVAKKMNDYDAEKLALSNLQRLQNDVCHS